MSAFAAIDCGSNSTRLLIVDSDRKVLCNELRTTRLGEGMHETRLLSDVAIKRTLEAIVEYKALLDSYTVTKLRVAATSAARDATNSGELQRGVADILGQPLEILTGEEEGAVTYAGAVRSESGLHLVVDIGGGSTELALGQGQQLLRAKSFDVGCVRMTDRFFAGGPYVEDHVVAAVGVIDRQWGEFAIPPGTDVVGVAGTITTLASIEIGLQSYVPGAVDGVVLTSARVIERLTTLATMTPAELANVPGMPERRVGIIVAGVAILSSLMRQFGVSELRVSESDILDGLLPL